MQLKQYNRWRVQSMKSVQILFLPQLNEEQIHAVFFFFPAFCDIFSQHCHPVDTSSITHIRGTKANSQKGFYWIFIIEIWLQKKLSA